MWMTVWCAPDSHPHIITSTVCGKNTVVFPGDGHIFAPKYVEIDIYIYIYIYIYIHTHTHTHTH